MSRFNSILATLLPYSPKWLIRPFAAPYFAGESEDLMVEIVRSLNLQGFSTTIDILGEHVQSTEEATTIRNAYCRLYDRIASERLDANISLKLTHLGLEIDRELAQENVLSVLSKAQEHNNFLRIDMENSPYTDTTIDIYRHCLNETSQVGMVLQSYLHRTLKDISELDSAQFNCRICKGIYKEPDSIAYHERSDIRDNFILSVQEILSGTGYAAIATHDLLVIDALETWIENKRIPHERFEFQVLYGVPMGNRLQQLMEKNFKVRIYVPFGEAWYDYSFRRLKENPDIIGYILHNLFKS